MVAFATAAIHTTPMAHTATAPIMTGRDEEDGAEEGAEEGEDTENSLSELAWAGSEEKGTRGQRDSWVSMCEFEIVCVIMDIETCEIRPLHDKSRLKASPCVRVCARVCVCT